MGIEDDLNPVEGRLEEETEQNVVKELKRKELQQVK